MAAEKTSTVTINFANAKAAKHFVAWLDGQGEQNYWVWMECREQEEKGDITATHFAYDRSLNVETTVSRLDRRKR